MIIEGGGPWTRWSVFQAAATVAMNGFITWLLWNGIWHGQKADVKILALGSAFLFPAILNSYRLLRLFLGKPDLPGRTYNVALLVGIGISLLVAFLAPESWVVDLGPPSSPAPR